MKTYSLLILSFILSASLTAIAATSSNRNQSASVVATATTPEPATAQTMAQKLQQYNEMSERVHEHRFRGGADEDQLKVLPQLPKPEHGVIGSQMQAQDNQERSEEHGEEPAGEPQHD